MTTFRFAPLALLVATAAPAAANTIAVEGSPPPAPVTDQVHDSSPESNPAAERRLEGRVSWLVGGADVGDADGFSMGVSGGIGYRIGNLTLRATLDHYGAGDGDDEAMHRRGRSTRIGGAVRYSLAHTAEHERTEGDAAVDLWGEVGYGLEHVAWTEGGVLDRASGEFAVGFDFDARGRRDEQRRRRHIGYFMAFRTFVGEGPEMTTAPTCGGPCTKATQPSRIDFSMFYELGFHWGH